MGSPGHLRDTGNRSTGNDLCDTNLHSAHVSDHCACPADVPDRASDHLCRTSCSILRSTSILCSTGSELHNSCPTGDVWRPAHICCSASGDVWISSSNNLCCAH